jgi:hypothetical protein
MSDLPLDSAADHEAEWTAAPETIGVAAPPGPVSYCEVADDEGLAGYFWITARTDVRPRAGIVLLHPDIRDPSIVMQDDLGETALRLNDNREADAAEVVQYLAETRNGQGGKALVSEARTATSVDVVRGLAGWTS